MSFLPRDEQAAEAQIHPEAALEELPLRFEDEEWLRRVVAKQLTR